MMRLAAEGMGGHALHPRVTLRSPARATEHLACHVQTVGATVALEEGLRVAGTSGLQDQLSQKPAGDRPSPSPTPEDRWCTPPTLGQALKDPTRHGEPHHCPLASGTSEEPRVRALVRREATHIGRAHELRPAPGSKGRRLMKPRGPEKCNAPIRVIDAPSDPDGECSPDFHRLVQDDWLRYV